MVPTEKSPCLDKPGVNWNLLPIKTHYFFYYGALGGVLPYLPVLGKSLGINATAVGIVYGVLPFAILFSKPAFGAIADHFRNLKCIMIILVFVSVTSFSLILFVPPLPKPRFSEMSMICHENYTLLNLSSAYNATCTNELTSTNIMCDFKVLNPHSCHSSQQTFPLDLGPLHFVNGSSVVESSLTKTICQCSKSSTTTGCNPKLDDCVLKDAIDNQYINVYASYSFWLYALLNIIGGTSAATVFCLSDAACTELLGEQQDLYGRQRLWGTISWGFVTLLTGHLNDMVSMSSNTEDYSSGFYIMIALVLVDLVILNRIKLTKVNFSTSICKDVSRIFTSFEIISFAVAVFIIGGLTGLLWQYQFWYLQDLGASQLLLGLTVAIQCLLAEVPFFFVSGKIIKTFGHFSCLIATFLAFAVRYALYYFLKDPWWVLPIEILHGQSYGVFYATMTSFAISRSPSGTEATMLGVLGGLFEGLGAAVGNLLSGVGFDEIGGHATFLVASGISAVCTVVYSFIKCGIRTPSTSQDLQS